MITVWGRASSSNVQTVLWCLQELGVDFKRIDAGFTYGVNNTKDSRAMNPNGFVPTLQDGSNPPLFESCAICRYLANQYAPETFWPTDFAQRAVVDMWAEWSKLNVAQNISYPLFWPKVRLAPEATSEAQYTAALNKVNVFLKIADDRLASSTFLVSDDFTLADIIFGHTLFRYFDIDINRTDFKHLSRYYEMLSKRPAYQDKVMVSYEELRYKG